MSERLTPRNFNHDAGVVCRHIERYLKAVKLLKRYPRDTDVWLNFGCGDTYSSELLSNFCGQVVAYDKDPSVLGTSSKKINYLKKLPLTSKYDAVFLIEVFEHVDLEEAYNLLAELRERKKPNCYLMLTTPIVPKTNFKPVNPNHKVEYSLKDFNELVKKAGMAIKDLELYPVKFTDGETKEQGVFKLL